jgi:hypothetical protein
VSELNEHKLEHTFEIIDSTYASFDICFLQETALVVKAQFEARPTTSALFECYMPELACDRNQNSTILLKRGWLTNVVEVTAELMANASENEIDVNCGDGDLFALRGYSPSTGEKYLLVSFHGDSNGLATPGVVAAVDALSSTEPFAQHRLIVGLDANAWETEKKGVMGYETFMETLRASRLLCHLHTTPTLPGATATDAASACSSSNPSLASAISSNIARTHLQPQFHKAVFLANVRSDSTAKPCDYILHRAAQFDCGPALEGDTHRDNTGRGVFVPGQLCPTLAYPSDHCVVSALLTLKP